MNKAPHYFAVIMADTLSSQKEINIFINKGLQTLAEM